MAELDERWSPKWFFCKGGKYQGNNNSKKKRQTKQRRTKQKKTRTKKKTKTSSGWLSFAQKDNEGGFHDCFTSPISLCVTFSVSCFRPLGVQEQKGYIATHSSLSLIDIYIFSPLYIPECECACVLCTPFFVFLFRSSSFIFFLLLLFSP